MYNFLLLILILYFSVVTTTNKTLSQSQIQMYRQQQQNIARQQQVKMVSARATKTSSTNIIPIQTPQTPSTVNVRPKNTINTRNITETDVTNFIKRHQLLQQKQAQAVTSQTSISSTGPSIVKTSVQSLMLSTGAKNAISVATATKNINPQQQQFRHLTLQPPMLAHRKMPAQKVTQLSQVVVNFFFYFTILYYYILYYLIRWLVKQEFQLS